MDRTVIVTGAKGNLGSNIVQNLHTKGYNIFGTIGPREQEVPSDLERVQLIPLDLTDETAVQNFANQLKPEVNAAVLTAGGFAPGGFEQTNADVLSKMFLLNFNTAFFLVKALLAHFEKHHGGQIILIGSRPALNPEEGKNLIAYSLSKKLIFYLAELINAHGKGKNIDATVIVPSTIDTPTNRAFMQKADFEKWVSPEAIADTVAFVLSDAGQQMRESVLKMYNES